VRLVLAPLALTELGDAAAFYATKGTAELGLSFVGEFERVSALILANPESGVIFRGAWRRYFLRRFPFSVIYQITSEEVRVIAIAHQRRRPGYWARRK
jgi:toxin ParE1/3/4